MTKTSTCPICQNPIALLEAPEASLVECPHCRQQYELVEALDFVAESDEEDTPPELTLVEFREIAEKVDEPEPVADDEIPESEELPDWEPPEEELAEEPLDEEELETPAVKQEAPEEAPVQVRCPCCREFFALQDLLLAETDSPIGAEAAAAILSDGIVREPEGESDRFQFSFGTASATGVDHSEFRLASVEERPSASPSAFEFAAAAGTSPDRAEEAEAARTRRRRRERNVMKDLVGAILGGAAGLLITYYLLNLIGGPRFDMFKVYLPGVKHTAVHRPAWLGGPPEEEPFDSGIDDAIGKEQETPEPIPKEPKPNDDSQQVGTGAAEPAEMPGDQPVEEEGLPADHVGLISPPQVTSEQLGQALRDVDRLAKAGPLTEEAYEAWCRVAEAATFLDHSGTDVQTRNRLEVMRGLLKEIPKDDVVTIGQYATRRTLDPNRPNHGILLAGIARTPNTEKGKGYMTGLQVAGTGAKVVIASDRKLPIQPDDRILLLGYLVDEPKTATQGLDTELPQITWVQTVVKFEH